MKPEWQERRKPNALDSSKMDQTYDSSQKVVLIDERSESKELSLQLDPNRHTDQAPTEINVPTIFKWLNLLQREQMMAFGIPQGSSSRQIAHAGRFYCHIGQCFS